jgi:SAM-dependent methyltransferase
MEPSLARYFDAVIPWEKRLAREVPLLCALAREAGARHVLVPACGTGGHVASLAERGFHVCGFDVDEDALAIAREKVAARAEAIRAGRGEARLMNLPMERAGELGDCHDAAFVLGNALPGLSAPGRLLEALRGVAATLRPGGIFLTQNLNYDLRWREKQQFFPVLSGDTGDEEVLLVKFAEYGPEYIHFHGMFLARPKSGGAWQSQVRSSKQIPLFRERLLDALREGGFGEFECWGDYVRGPFETERSRDLLVFATKLPASG